MVLQRYLSEAERDKYRGTNKGADSIIRPFVSVSIQWEPVARFPPFRGWLERTIHASANGLGFLQLVQRPFPFRHCRA